MSNHQGQRPRNATAPWLSGQMTVGECLAVARYESAFRDPETGLVNAEELSLFITRQAVCENCGWSWSIHDASLGADKQTGICGHYVHRAH